MTYRDLGVGFFWCALELERFIQSAIRKLDRLKKRSESRRRRIQEHDFEPAEKVTRDFEERIGRSIKKIDTSTRVGTKLE